MKTGECEKSMQQPDSLIGQVLGHYRIIKQIGSGGIATVSLAEDVNLGREVAVKAFWPRPGETRDFLKRFEREARVLAKLDHPNILPVFDYGEQNGFAYLITPYLSGGSLKEMLQKRKVIPPVEALRMAPPGLNSLQYASERWLIHRYIKPANMLFKGDDSPLPPDYCTSTRGGRLPCYGAGNCLAEGPHPRSVVIPRNRGRDGRGDD